MTYDKFRNRDLVHKKGDVMLRPTIDPQAKVELAELMEHARATKESIDPAAIDFIRKRYNLVVDKEKSIDEVTEIMYQISRELPENKH